jgi:hypothetical protein
MTSATFCGSTSEAVRTWAGLTNMGLLVCGLMKHTNLVDIGRSSWVNAAAGTGHNTVWASLTHPHLKRRLKGPEGRVRGPLVPASFSCTLLPIMPRDGANLLSDVRVPVLTVVCEPCGRRERHDVERLARQYGWDAKLTDLLTDLVADGRKRGSANVCDRCKAVFERRG